MRRELQREGEVGEVREGVEGVSVAHFGVLGRPGSSKASRWRPRRARPLQRAALGAGEEDDRGLRWAGPVSGPTGQKPGKLPFLFLSV